MKLFIIIWLSMLALLLMLGNVKADYDIIIGVNTTISGICTSINNGICPYNASCNISMQYPNTSIFINNTATIFQSPYWTYNIPNTTIEGAYPSVLSCCYGVVCNSTAFNINIMTFQNSVYSVEMGGCPSSPNELIIFILVIGISLIISIMALAYKWGIIGLFSSMMLMICSWPLSMCFGLAGLILGCIGFIMFVGFIFKPYW